MQKSYVPVKAVQREIRKQTGKNILTRDLANIRGKTEREERQGRDEEDVLEEVLKDIQKKDSGAFIDVVTNQKTEQILCITLITSTMQNNFDQNPNICFLDGTYKVNLENYCLYAMVATDRHGKGRPVALAFMPSEKAANIDAFFESFKKAHKNWNQIEIIFVDKDYNEIRALRKHFPDVHVL